MTDLDADVDQRLAALDPAARSALLRRLRDRAGSAPDRNEGRADRSGARETVSAEWISPITPRPPAHPDLQPVTFEQQRLWFLDRFEPGSSAHTIPLVLDLEGALDVDRLQGALDALVERHEALRTTFVEGDRPRQLISRPAPVAVRITDLREYDQGEAERMAEQAIAAESAVGFDLVVGPLLRVLVIRLTPTRWVLQLTLHHAIADGWSLGILTSELSALYGTADALPPTPTSLTPLPVQYADYAVWQRRTFTPERIDELVTRWRADLIGVPPMELPTDRPRPPVRRSRGSWVSTRWPAELDRRIGELAMQRGTTPFVVVLSALEVVLSRLTGQRDFAVGTVLAGRDRPELEPLVGYVARTVAVRSDLKDESDTFASLVDDVAARMLDVHERTHLPFERLIDALDLPRDPSRTPLFTVFLALQNTPLSDVSFDGLEVRTREADTRSAQFDLSLYIAQGAAGSEVGLEYDTDLFDRATVLRWLGHLRTTLEAATADAQLALGALPLLSADEVRRQVQEWNDTETPLPQQTLVDRLDDIATTRPDDPAVRASRSPQTLTYAGLRDRSLAVSHWLAERGVGAGDLVGVGGQRTPDLVAALLGVLRRGAAYVPLDPAYPRNRLDQMVADSRMTAIISDSSSVGAIPVAGLEVLLMDVEPPSVGDEALTPTTALVEAPAYCIFTSGSTGRPKGVVVSHSALANLIDSVIERCGLDATTHLLAVTSLSFDIAGLELWAPLVAGGCVTVCDEGTASDGVALARLLSQSGATAMQATPATWRLLCDAGWEGAAIHALCGGEALPEELAERIRPLVVRLWNMYGPTETTIWSAVEPVLGGEVLIGGPLRNTRLHVVDGNGRLAPPGVAGELWIAGAGLATGYLGRPAMTAERFVPDPFSPIPGGRAYRTGDLVRQRDDGRLRFIARLDHQVKVRGHRIELGDVESSLEDHPGVEQAVVIVTTAQDAQLVAYVRARAGCSTTVTELRDHLGGKLPAYMIPSRFALVDTFPLTPNGKTDRSALPDPNRHAMATGTVHEDPSGEVEETLATIWSELLGGVRVGRSDGFFALGGDSLIAVRMVAAAGQAGIQLTTQQVFRHQSLADLAAAAGTVALVAAQGEVTGPLALPIATHQFLDGVNPEAHFHSIAFQFGTRERIDPAVLEGVLGELLAHHDSLRARAILGGDGRWASLHIDPVRTGPVLEVVSAGDVSDAAIEETIATWTDAVETGFVPEEGGLFRAVLLDFGPDREQRLLLAGHYLVADVVSWHILVADLDVLYRRRAAGEPYRLPAKTTSMPEWVDRLVTGALDGEADSEIPLWTDPQRASAHPIPVDRASGDNRVRSNDAAFLVLPVEETGELMERAVRGHRLSLDAVLLHAIGRSVVADDTVLAVDLYVPGRESPYPDMDLARTIGWLTYRYPMWLDLGRHLHDVEAVRAISAQLAAIPRGGLGAGQLRYYSGDEGTASVLRSQPVPDVLFNFFGAAPGGFQTLRPIAGTSGHYHDVESDRMRPLMINGALIHGQLRLEWEFSGGRHDRASVEGFIADATEHLIELTHQCEPAGGLDR